MEVSSLAQRRSRRHLHANGMCRKVLKEPHMAVRQHLLNLLWGPPDFRIHEVLQPSVTPPAVAVPSPLGPLSEFAGNWTGQGFNTIFRPESTTTPTALPVPLNHRPSPSITSLNSI